MHTKRGRTCNIMGALSVGLSLVGCNMVIGLNKYSVEAELTDRDAGDKPTEDAGQMLAETGTPDDAGPEASVAECTTNAECTDRATAHALDAGSASEGGPPAIVPAVCMKPEGRCVELLSADCNAVTGDYRNDDAVLIGTLFSTKGSQAATNLPRQQSATMAAEEINQTGGLPPAAVGGNTRPLVVVSCDESTDLVRAAKHLVLDLRVPAIVGPNTSQDTLDVSNKVTIPAGTLVMTPTAVASGIADLSDQGLTWLMVPSDVQRAPLMIEQIGELETMLRTERATSTIKLGVIFRNDALGIGTRTSLNTMSLNGKSLTDSISAGNAKIEGYDFKQADQSTLVAKYKDFAPDIIVLAGTAETITSVMNPLEAAWNTSVPRPYYVVIDSVKVPELLIAASNPELRNRIRGTGIVAGAQSMNAATSFNVNYQVKFGVNPSASGMGSSYDATYAIAYAMAATHDLPVTGANLSKGLRKLAGGATSIEVGTQKVLAAFQKLVAGESIAAVGTFGPLEWDNDGAVLGGVIQMWCIGAPSNMPAYQPSGLNFDLKTQKLVGSYKQCL